MSLPVILLAFANDRQGSFLRGIAEENKAILEALQPAQDKKLCEVELIPDATVQDLVDAFQRLRGRVRIFHYGGHADGDGLLISSGGGETAAVDGASFAEFLRQQKGLELVFLNGCSSQGQAQGLLGASIPNVIATSRAINDETARTLAGIFYSALASGATLSAAFEEAKAGVMMQRTGQTRSLVWEGKDDIAPEEVANPWHWFGAENNHELADFNVLEQVNRYVAKSNLAGAVELLLQAADSQPQKEALAMIAMHLSQLQIEVAAGKASGLAEQSKLTAALLGLAREVADPDSDTGDTTAQALIAALSQPVSIKRQWRGTRAYVESDEDPDMVALAENWDGYMKSVAVLFGEDGNVYNWSNYGTRDAYQYNAQDKVLIVMVANETGGFETTMYKVVELTANSLIIKDPNTGIIMDLVPEVL